MDYPPHIGLNWLSIIAATVAGFVIGGLWYGPLFGRKWGTLMGMPMDRKPDPAVMKRAFLLQALGLLLTSIVMFHLVQVWRPSMWNAGADKPLACYGFYTALFVWAGFYIPLQLGKISWELKPWKVFFINAGHDFVTLMVIGQIVAHLH
jgi:hypothetical protein